VARHTALIAPRIASQSDGQKSKLFPHEPFAPIKITANPEPDIKGRGSQGRRGGNDGDKKARIFARISEESAKEA